MVTATTSNHPDWLIGPGSRHEDLIERDRLIIALLADGFRALEVGPFVHMASSSVRDRIKQLREQAGARNACHLVAIALRDGVIE